MIIVVMGVTGAGKTTIGLKLAAALGWTFRDGDDFHSAENVAKMSSGVPLTDRDRVPWLAAIRTYIDACLARGENTIVACSALRESHRQALVGDPARVRLVHLAGDHDVILERLRQRQGHFMRPEMLQSQFAALEAPGNALVLDVTQPPEAIVAEIRAAFSV